MSDCVHVDLETFSRCDLKSCGGHRYAADPSTEILCIGLALNDEEPVIYVPDATNRFFGGYDYDDFDRAVAILKLMSHRDTLCYAHNATGFEVPHFDLLFEKQTGFNPPAHHQWRCTAAMARRAALPPSLEKCAEALKLSQKKDTRGKALIRKFCIPQKDGRRILPSDEPEAFKELCEYCKTDVTVERLIHKALGHFELTGTSLQTFQTDLELNCRGIPVNVNGLKKAKVLVDQVVADAEVEFKSCTGLNPTQGAKFLQWLKDRGYSGEDLRAETMDEQIEGMEFDPTSEVGCALLLRQKVSFAAVKKIDAMLACAGPHDSRVRGCFQYYGASTGRWSGSLIQPQNFKRPTVKHTEMAYDDICKGGSVDHIEFVYGPILEVVSSSIRHFIHDVRPFFQADYAAIEARIVCWLAGQEDALDEYRNKVDRYVRLASVIFAKPEKDINKHPERFIGKQSTLGCGYGMSGPKFRLTCEKFGYKDLEKGLEFRAVEAFREKHTKVVDYWYACQDAAIKAIQAPGQKYKVRNVTFFVAGTAGIRYLWIVLPSGRKLAYPHVKLEPLLSYMDKGVRVQHINPTPQQINKAAEVDENYMLKESITYWGKPQGKAVWTRVSSYYGRIVENITQAVAADIMAHGTARAEEEGYQTIALIHDEILVSWRQGGSVEHLVECITDLPAWADGLPIEAEGSMLNFYSK